MAKDKAGLDVTYHQMESAAKHLKSQKIELQKQLGDLKKYVEGLVEDGFVTEKSSKAFEESFSEFTKGASDTIEGLEGMGGFLKSAAKAFDDLDIQLKDGLKK